MRYLLCLIFFWVNTVVSQNDTTVLCISDSIIDELMNYDESTSIELSIEDSNTISLDELKILILDSYGDSIVPLVVSEQITHLSQLVTIFIFTGHQIYFPSNLNQLTYLRMIHISASVKDSIVYKGDKLNQIELFDVTLLEDSKINLTTSFMYNMPNLKYLDVFYDERMSALEFDNMMKALDSLHHLENLYLSLIISESQQDILVDYCKKNDVNFLFSDLSSYD